MVKDKLWKAAVELVVGDILVTSDGKEQVVKFIKVEEKGYPVTTYNLTVEDNHTFFVSDEGVLTHNMNNVLKGCNFATEVSEKLTKGVADAVEDVKYGEHFTKVDRKKVLKPNVCYETVEGYKYKTNDVGAITEVEGTLKLGEGNRNLYAQRIAGGDYRLPDDDGGHLIASQFLGSGELDNLVPMNSQINRSGGKWYNMEQEWANALKEGKEVKVKIEPIYDSDNLRPVSFKVKYNIDGQRTKIIGFVLINC